MGPLGTEDRAGACAQLGNPCALAQLLARLRPSRDISCSGLVLRVLGLMFLDMI